MGQRGCRERELSCVSVQVCVCACEGVPVCVRARVLGISKRCGTGFARSPHLLPAACNVYTHTHTHTHTHSLILTHTHDIKPPAQLADVDELLDLEGVQLYTINHARVSAGRCGASRIIHSGI